MEGKKPTSLFWQECKILEIEVPTNFSCIWSIVWIPINVHVLLKHIPPKIKWLNRLPPKALIRCFILEAFLESPKIKQICPWREGSIALYAVVEIALRSTDFFEKWVAKPSFLTMGLSVVRAGLLFKLWVNMIVLYFKMDSHCLISSRFLMLTMWWEIKWHGPHLLYLRFNRGQCIYF